MKRTGFLETGGCRHLRHRYIATRQQVNRHVVPLSGGASWMFRAGMVGPDVGLTQIYRQRDEQLLWTAQAPDSARRLKSIRSPRKRQKRTSLPS